MDQLKIQQSSLIDITFPDLHLYANYPDVLVLYGFPYDEGTIRNKGRPGGEEAYSKIIAELKSMQIISKFPVLHLGALPKDMELEAAHIHLYKCVAEIFYQLPNARVMVLGGSNDQSYPNFKGLVDGLQNHKIGVINIDAHLDVRPLVQGKAHSGSPFRQMLEDTERYQNSQFVEFAIKGCTSSYDHYQYVIKKKGKVLYLEKDIRRSQGKIQALECLDGVYKEWEQSKDIDWIFMSFDVDSINSVWCPGVSAPSIVGGLTYDEALGMMRRGGESRKVKLVDLSEFNPAVECQRSVKLIGEMIQEYIQGMDQGVQASS